MGFYLLVWKGFILLLVGNDVFRLLRLDDKLVRLDEMLL